MVTWKKLAAVEPELAKIGCFLLFQHGVGLAFLATIRKDGGPRLHPVCPVLADDHLYLLITPTSPKRYDLLRDGRYALQSFPQDKEGSEEFYMTGRAECITDGVLRAAVFRATKHIASEHEVLFELKIEQVMHTRWENIGTPHIRPIHRKWRTSRVTQYANSKL
ncbi:MAG: hypothetical protein FJ147_03585 [Deltaproteobacteria bacterium]|nr:hypothetical protein [Deltaproteobacteria bacterium]